MADVRNSDRRCEAPQGGAITIPDLRNSDRRCEAPQGGAITWTRGAMTSSGLSGASDCRVPVMLPPYALSAPVFKFRHLATLAGRAPIGGAREVALACFVAARLAADCCDPALDLDEPARAARCAGAKLWLGTIAIPSPVRT